MSFHCKKRPNNLYTFITNSDIELEIEKLFIL